MGVHDGIHHQKFRKGAGATLRWSQQTGHLSDTLISREGHIYLCMYLSALKNLTLRGGHVCQITAHFLL